MAGTIISAFCAFWKSPVGIRAASCSRGIIDLGAMIILRDLHVENRYRFPDAKEHQHGENTQNAALAAAGSKGQCPTRRTPQTQALQISARRQDRPSQAGRSCFFRLGYQPKDFCLLHRFSPNYRLYLKAYSCAFCSLCIHSTHVLAFGRVCPARSS